MHDWASRLAVNPEYGHIVSGAIETKHDTRAIFDALGLLAYKRYLGPVSDFVANSDGWFNELGTPSYWFQVVDGTLKQTSLDVSREEITQKVLDLYGALSKDAKLLISEYLPNRYGGNIVVTPELGLYAEFGKGNNSDYTAGNVTPTHFATADIGAQPLHYSFKDTELRTTLWGAMKQVRKIPGYYEFILAEENGKLVPIFTDARIGDSIYQLPQSTAMPQAAKLGEYALENQTLR